MTHVLPPQPHGALAALQARPDADVVFAAHTGLGLAAYPTQFWREMPIGGTLHTRMWLAPRAEVPTSDDEQVAWLYDWWERIDGWIAAQQPAATPQPAGQAAAQQAAQQGRETREKMTTQRPDSHTQTAQCFVQDAQRASSRRSARVRYGHG